MQGRTAQETDIILFPFKAGLNSERLCVSEMEMGKLSTECLSKGFLAGFSQTAPFCRGLEIAKGKLFYG